MKKNLFLSGKIKLLLLCALLSTPFSAQNNDIKFEHLRVQEGLPNNNITYIFQDHLGFLWFGTEGGFVKYDGYSMELFLDSTVMARTRTNVIREDQYGNLWIGTDAGLIHYYRNRNSYIHYSNSNGPFSISSNFIKDIYLAKDGNMWVGTDKGLDLFNSDKNNFSHYYIEYNDTNITSIRTTPNNNSGAVNSIIEDPFSGNLLVGSDIPGLWLFDLKSFKFAKYNLENNINGFNNISINAFHQGQSNTIWIISDKVLARFDPKTKQFKLYQLIKSSNNLPQNNLTSAIEESGGFIWVGCKNGDLIRFNPLNGEFYIFKNDPNDEHSILPSSPWGILSILADNSGIIWISSSDFGLNKYNPYKTRFNSYRYNLDQDKSLGNNIVMSMIEDRAGIIWIGTQGGGLVKYDRKNNIFRRYTNNPNNKNSLSDNFVIALCEDPIEDGILWIGTTNGGLNKFFINSNNFKNYLNPGYNRSEGECVFFVLPDGNEFIWICTYWNGLYKFNKKYENFTHYLYNPDDSLSLNSNDAWYCYKDNLGNLWIGTLNTSNGKGLHKYDYNLESFNSYPSIENVFGPSNVSTIYEDRAGRFWVADYISGLFLFNRENGEFEIRFTQKDGLPSNQVMSILEDDKGYLWISTYNGLSRFDPVTKSFKNYYENDGLSSNKFFFHSAFQSRSGELFFGGENGFSWFNPKNMREDPVPPKVLITNLSLFNRPEEKLEIDGFISEMEDIKLSYNQNDLRIDYVGLHFAEPSKNKYKYHLENFDEDWVDAGTQRNAVYTNLDAGEYVFRVRAANRDGVWNEEGASIRLIISPPFWATTWAYVFYALVVLGIIYFTWKLQLKRIRIKHDYEMSKFEAEKMHEVDELKSRFFANISHEFRTPLTLILGISKKVLEKAKDQVFKDDIGVIKRNAKRLHRLVNQLLDLSKLESGNIALQTSPINIIPFLKKLVLSFASFAERKRITLNFNSVEEEIVAYVDKDKIEKIITNLLSNAFKFTPEGGRIEFSAKKSDNNIEMIISDTGIGISPERMDKIFDRFYQVDSSQTREQEGTGLGLALTKELVELHRGKIKVESSEGKGSTFTVTIPLGKDHLRPEEIVDGKIEEEEVEAEEVELGSEYEEQKERSDIEVLTETGKLLLIVEDNVDVRNYIKSDLKNEYTILEAVNGEEGLNQAIRNIPDLIISDIMMPKMDGFEMCEKLKTDERTSHIPIIILTAKATDKDKIVGFETGADEYVMKPFDNIILKSRIKNLIQQRERLREHFVKEGIFQINDTNARAIDKIFLKKALKVINKHISDETFGVDLFADEIAMSKSQLRRKLVALVGESPSDLIRSIRLRKAAKLLEQHFGNVSEIAAEVGFNNPSNFAQVFKKHFGVLPTEYLNSKKT